MFSGIALHKNSYLGLCAALLCAGSMWFYVQRVLIPYERADAAAHQRPRGNLSDLYPRWLGARELLLRHRNPYADDITTEIQEGYYGRALDPARPNDPRDQQGFAYPVYVVFVLAPLIGFPFHGVQIFFYWLLLGLTGASVWLWLRALRWRLPPLPTAICIAFVMGSFPVVQGIKLEQLTLLVAALLAASVACVTSEFLFFGGALLALSTIKPQLAWPLVAWLVLWAVSDWAVRQKFLFGFSLVMVAFVAGAEFILPGWWRMFAHAIQQYHRYTQNQSVLDVLLPWVFAGKVVAAAAVIVSGFFLWRVRRAPADSTQFGLGTALVMALAVMVVPMYAPYNQVLLVPAILVLARDRAIVISRFRAIRVISLLAIVALAWQWIASVGLTIAWFVSPAWALGRWWLPFIATFALPVLVFALVLLNAQNAARRSARVVH